LPVWGDTPQIGRQYCRALAVRQWNFTPGRICTSDPIASPEPRPDTLRRRLRRLLVGSPRDLKDSRLFHRLALIPFLAWVGLGADGLSSSAYGPEEAFKALGEHAYLAVALAALMAATVLLISAAYRRIIEEFPSGGGGYVVASSLLGPAAGVVSGAALLVDYVLTITVSIAAAGDALFSFLPLSWHPYKLLVEVGFILVLTTLNIRGVRESVMALVPVFLLFVLTHAMQTSEARVDASSFGYGGYYDWHGWQAWGPASAVQIREVATGTLLVDVLDGASGKLIW